MLESPPDHTDDRHPAEPGTGSPWEVFRVALRLGVTSFGGPIAHIGYFQDEYVKRRHWVDEATFADLVALAQSLPGAASSKLGMSIGMIRAGLRGAIAAWVGFTMPSAILIVIFALGAESLGSNIEGWLHGLQAVAVAVVALAVWQMAGKLAPDLPRGSLAIAAAIAALTLPSQVTTVSIVVAAGVIGYFALRHDDSPRPTVRLPASRRRTAVVATVVLLGLLAGLPLLRHLTGNQTVALFDAFYRSGALVFGGGNVVLPLLETEVVDPGWVSEPQFLAGYGAAQAVPGPLFTFAAYLGAVVGPAPNGILGAAIALVAIFVPSFLLVLATMPSLGAIRTRPGAQAVLRGVNAAVVGVLLAALYDPLWTRTVHDAVDFSLVLGAFGLLVVGKLPPWLVVILVAAAGAAIAALRG
jgi:chromate transporter